MTHCLHHFKSLHAAVTHGLITKLRSPPPQAQAHKKTQHTRKQLIPYNPTWPRPATSIGSSAYRAASERNGVWESTTCAGRGAKGRCQAGCRGTAEQQQQHPRTRNRAGGRGDDQQLLQQRLHLRLPHMHAQPLAQLVRLVPLRDAAAVGQEGQRVQRPLAVGGVQPGQRAAAKQSSCVNVPGTRLVSEAEACNSASGLQPLRAWPHRWAWGSVSRP